ncbi:hypothetical protein M231_02783 [Tremella mesenterica]|uniref:Uncharacterized protein n=1 Tax=Tremella mesenterica TaxID=5217 RepID=A0A4Q1BPZ9_TREME|nr:hypothetical protein M231_02783 [Tremella mesenterica]
MQKQNETREIIYLNDRRYPAPKILLPKPREGLPTQEELDAEPKIWTWGELKAFIYFRPLEPLGRSAALQKRYKLWVEGVKQDFGTVENYLMDQLPWNTLAPSLIPPKSPQIPLIDPPSSPGSPSPVDPKIVDFALTDESPPLSPLGSSESEPSSPSTAPSSIMSMQEDEELYLRWDPTKGLDETKFVVKFNDWPYSLPHGVRHYVVWSKVPIAHPELVNNDPEQWSVIQERGLTGMTGVLPLPEGTKPGDPEIPSEILEPRAGDDVKRWTGVQFECPGGHEVGRMVRSLWDERGWECLWLLNPIRNQSVRGLSHFHVLARRKMPEEIDVAERIFVPQTSYPDGEEGGREVGIFEERG